MILFLQPKLDRLREPYDRTHCDVNEKKNKVDEAESKLDTFNDDHTHDPIYLTAVSDMVAWKGRDSVVPAVVGRETDCEATSPMSTECQELKRKVRALRAVDVGGGDWRRWL